MVERPSVAHEENVMSNDRVDRTVVTQDRTPTAGQPPLATAAGQTAAPSVSQETVRTDSQHITRGGPGGSEMARRIIVLVFGLIQIVIGLRIVLLLLDARTGNALVSGILDISKIFVAPFEGILNSNALTAGGSTLDVAAVVAFVGWSLLELIVLWAVGIFRREPA
jgi:YGGT family